MVANLGNGVEDLQNARECNYNGNSYYITGQTQNGTTTDSKYIYARYRGVRD